MAAWDAVDDEGTAYTGVFGASRFRWSAAWPPALGTSVSSGHLCMLLVALQVGLQPAVTRACVSSAVSGHSLVIIEMVVSMVLALAITPPDAFVHWSALESIALVGPPALIYAVRSLFKQAAYRRCDAVTFNVINQTKVVFCAMGAWLLIGEEQSMQQVLALACAVGAGALLVAPSAASAGSNGSPARGSKKATLAQVALMDDVSPKSLAKTPACGAPEAPAASGALLALATAACSGVAAALSQSSMRASPRPSSLFNFELALWGAPFAMAACASEVQRAASCGGCGPATLLRGWQLSTLAPVALQAVGGLLVSAVVQREGGVAMGLCTVAGIAVSAAADAVLTRRLPSQRQATASTLAILSVVVHQRASS